MPKNPDILPRRDHARLLVFLAFPDMGLLDLTGPQTVFATASRAMERRGLSGYRVETVSLKGGVVQAAEGVAVQTVPVTRVSQKAIDTLIIPGSPHIQKVTAESASLVKWLATLSEKAQRTVSVCSGAFLLARTGLLDNKRAATHWAMCDVLREQHPSIDVDNDAIFVREDTIWTSAGVSAGIDVALALVETDCGRDIAMEVARELVVFLKRPGGQSQFSEFLRSQDKDGFAFDDLHAWIADNLGLPNLSVDTLAEQAGMSPRNFARVYKQKSGRTPAKAIEIFRLEAAKRLLEDSDRNIDQIARLCGFGDEERMRITFHRHLGIGPRDYRRRFSYQA
jgi:transcriptional regulator GlxA family with amidase domain